MSACASSVRPRERDGVRGQLVLMILDRVCIDGTTLVVRCRLETNDMSDVTVMYPGYQHLYWRTRCEGDYIGSFEAAAGVAAPAEGDVGFYEQAAYVILRSTSSFVGLLTVTLPSPLRLACGRREIELEIQAFVPVQGTHVHASWSGAPEACPVGGAVPLLGDAPQRGQSGAPRVRE